MVPFQFTGFYSCFSLNICNERFKARNKLGRRHVVFTLLCLTNLESPYLCLNHAVYFLLAIYHFRVLKFYLEFLIYLDFFFCMQREKRIEFHSPTGQHPVFIALVRRTNNVHCKIYPGEIGRCLEAWAAGECGSLRTLNPAYDNKSLKVNTLWVCSLYV